MKPDCVDLNKVTIPQADEQQRFLWNIILDMNAAKKPLPRFWYFPRMLPAVVIMTGDDHGNNGTAARFDEYIAASTPNCSVADWGCIRGTSYIYPTTPITDAEVARYVAAGLRDRSARQRRTVRTGLRRALRTSIRVSSTQFVDAYPSAPTPITNRTHCIVWSDWSTQPDRSKLNNGIRLDTNYYYWPDAWIHDRPGHVHRLWNAERFAKLTGQMIDVYQAVTQMTDESGQTYPKNIDTLLNNAVGPTGYYGAFTANMHNDSVDPTYAGEAGATAIVASAKAHNIPVVTLETDARLARRPQRLVIPEHYVERQHPQLHRVRGCRRQRLAGARARNRQFEPDHGRPIERFDGGVHHANDQRRSVRSLSSGRRVISGQLRSGRISANHQRNWRSASGDVGSRHVGNQ